MNIRNTRELVLERPLTGLEEEEALKIVLFNDEVNTFDWVIESLIDICDHSVEQAEQCAWIVHTKGKYAVKYGSFDDLAPRCTSLNQRGLSAKVE